DGFGTEVARRLLERPAAEGVHVGDFRIRGLDLALRILDGYDALILIDAYALGGKPGTLYIVEPEIRDSDPVFTFDGHSMDPVRVLVMARSLGARLNHVRIVGCEPESFGPPNVG